MEVPTVYQEGARVRLILEEDLPLRLELYNTLGQKITQVFAGNLSAGEHELALEIPAVARGLFVLRAEAKGRSMAVRVVRP
jgi:hypothetical protein